VCEESEAADGKEEEEKVEGLEFGMLKTLFMLSPRVAVKI